jgi:mercuric ion transport protein
MNDRALVRVGTVGAIIAAICCATPALAVLLPLIGLSAWLARADFIVIPLLFVFLGVALLGLYRHRATAAAQCDTHPAKKGLKS